MTKIKLNSRREEVSSEEIKSRRDFNSILNTYKTVSKPFYTKPLFIATSTLLVAAGIVTGIYLSYKPTQEAIEQAAVDTIKVEERKAFITPAFSNLRIPYESLTVDATRGGKLSLKNGTVIRIPGNAFADANGNSISGTIELRYREFRDAVDMLVAGIPMQYDSAGHKTQLESAGMFEILGFKDGQKVNVQKNLTVELSSKDRSVKFNQYFLDTIARNWQYIGRDRIAYETSKNHVVADTVSVIESPARDPYEDLQNNISELAKNTIEYRKQEPVKPAKLNARNYRFDLDVLPEEFPELIDYKGLQFEVDPSNKTFSEKMYIVDWDDVTLSHHTPGKNYSITFVKDKKPSVFVVYPVYQAKDSVKVMALYEKKFNAYEKKLAEKIAAEKKVQEELAKREEKIKMQRAKAAKEELNRSQAVSYMNIRNVFAVDRFGIYNSDCPFTYPNEVSLNISFVDENNTRLPVDIAYLIDYEKNSLFAHYCNNSRTYKFNYNPETRNMLFSVDSDNQVWTFSQEDFKTMKPVNGNYSFRMKRSINKFKTVQELKSYLLPTAKGE